jgi:precorrin-4/cobalt-precorrin-4 C11-methyltransferase
MNTDESSDRRHPVVFVGAGPGDPELITVKGQKVLMSADVVIYAGSLVPAALLEWTRSGADRISSAGMHLEEIVSAVETSFQAGKRVVRLHTGDPSLFGAVFEQMAELQRRSIPYRVIPGVTAAFAAAAAMGIEYTLPEICQTLILTRMEGRTPVPESEQLESLARHRASMAIYLSAGLAEPVAGILKKHYGEKADCVIAYRVSQPQEKIVFTTLDRLDATMREEKIDRQALIIVGRVLAVQPSSLQHKSKLYDRQFSHGFRK